MPSYADHDVITPPTNLKAYATHVPGPDTIDAAALARAEEALASLNTEFDGWMRTEVERLQAARDCLSGEAMSPQQHDSLYRAAHDIRGQGLTLGFPLAGDVADNLCAYLDGMTGGRTPPSLDFIDAHVGAIVSIVKNDKRDSADPAVRAVLWELKRGKERLLEAQASE